MRINVGARLRTERKAQNLSQADLERRTGLPRCRISWLENGRAIPTLETLEKISDALDIPLRQLFEEDKPDGQFAVTATHTGMRGSGLSGRKKGRFAKLQLLLSRMCDEDQTLL